MVDRNIPLVLITDTECYWARELTPNVLMIQADRAWHSFSAYTSLFSLLTTAMVQEKGDVMDRITEINRLRQRFAGYLERDNTDVGKKGATARRKSGRPAKPAK